jgi:hypothetical protein
MKTFAVVLIHNQSVSSVHGVNSEQEGLEVIKKMIQIILNRDITEEEIEEFDTLMEIYDDSDHDNVYTFSVNYVDDFKMEDYV